MGLIYLVDVHSLFFLFGAVIEEEKKFWGLVHGQRTIQFLHPGLDRTEAHYPQYPAATGEARNLISFRNIYVTQNGAKHHEFSYVLDLNGFMVLP